MNKILVVGQTPPPYGGQAIMIEFMLKKKFQHIELFHTRMCFSKEMNERGKISFYKITHLISIILNIYKFKLKQNVNVLYYPLSNSPKISIYRDFIILIFTRFIFKKVVFHFHAAGISEELPKMNIFLRKILYFCFKRPDLAITSSEHNPKDGQYLQAKKTAIIPLGIPDVNNPPFEKKLNSSKLNILFVGLLNSTKGEGYLLDAIHVLHGNGYNIRLTLAGKFESENYKEVFFDKVSTYNLTDYVDYKGVVTGKDKESLFIESDIFCFPSFFDSESFGIVLLEAMQYKLPLIATKWRGIQSVVQHGQNGFLVEIKSVEDIVNRIMYFAERPKRIIEFGESSREIYLEKYTLEKYLFNLEEELASI